ncbi:MAG TPA: hypothetical protein VF297_28590 [Pyrinomonadaceae bacterium]
MPCLTDLDARLDAQTDWRETYDEQLPLAEKVANVVPLLHVTSHTDPDRARFEDLLFEDEPVLPTSAAAHGYCSAETRKAEGILGLPHFVYMYAGRAFAGFGRVTLAFDERNFELPVEGSACPLDSGGWALQYIKSNLPDVGPKALRDFMTRASMDLSGWRDVFARHLAAYFTPITEYWGDGPPSRLDPEEIYAPERKNHWRAWAFEVHMLAAVSPLAAIKWCISTDEYDKLVVRALSEGKLPAVGTTPLSQFLRQASIFVENSSTDSCTEMEFWVKGKVAAALQ